MTLLTLVGGALLISAVGACLKETAKGFLPFLFVGGGFLLLAWAVERLGDALGALAAFSSWEVLSPYVKVLLKGLGVTYVVHIGADVCRDLGAAGIASKLLNEAYMASFASKWYVLFFYVLNFVMVGADLVLYIRNRRLDKKKNAETLQ